MVLQLDGVETTDLSHRYLWGPAVDQILATARQPEPLVAIKRFGPTDRTISRHVSMVVGLGLLLFPACGFTRLDTSVSESSFDSDAERARFVGWVCGVQIPTTATDFHIQYTQWLDVSLYASFTLPQDDFAELLQRVRHKADMAGDVFQVENEPHAETFEAVFRERGRIWSYSRGTAPGDAEWGGWSAVDEQALDFYLKGLPQRARLLGEAFRVCDEEREIDSMLMFMKDTRQVRIHSATLRAEDFSDAWATPPEAAASGADSRKST